MLTPSSRQQFPTAPIPFHPLADLFPLIEGAEFDALVQDIGAHGVREPVVTLDGKILDGRNRYRAAQAAGVPCPVREYDGDDPVAFVISLNLQRRHLDASQRAMVAAKIATLSDGQRQVGKFAYVATQADAATMLNVSERSVKSAAVVRDHGTPELKDAVERGSVAVSVAADIASVPVERQRDIIAALPRDAAGRLTPEAKKALSPVMRELRAEKMADLKRIARLSIAPSTPRPSGKWRWNCPARFL